MYIVPDRVADPLYVVTCVFNPIRYKARWKHYQRFAKFVKDSGAILYTIEAAFGDRTHALNIDDSECSPLHKYIQVRTDDEVWVKENLLNIAMTHLPPDAKYVAFVDADVAFARPNWVGETIHQLQHYAVVQMWSDAVDLDPDYQYHQMHKSFAWCLLNGEERDGSVPGSYYYTSKRKRAGAHLWHPGFAWAWRRDALDSVGRLIDWAILGSADKHMAHALIGDVEHSYHPDLDPTYRRKLEEWQFQAEKHIRRNVGYVSGLMVHYWHGPKAKRRYRDRWQILVNNAYNPDLDIKYDYQGVLQLNDRGDLRSLNLRDQIREYFRGRDEDAGMCK